MKNFIKNSIVTALLLTCTFVSKAQVKIGNNPTTINAGSVLELESTNKGFMMPRISLDSTTKWTLAGTATAGMTVYNTNAAIASGSTSYPGNGIGEYFWDGGGWVSKKAPEVGFIPKVVASASYGGGGTPVFDGNPAFVLPTLTVNYNDGNYSSVVWKYTVATAGTYNVSCTLGYGLFNNSANNAMNLSAVRENSSGVIQNQIFISDIFNYSYAGTQSALISMAGSATIRANVGDKLYFMGKPCNGCIGAYMILQVEATYTHVSL